MWIKFKPSDCNYQYTVVDLSMIEGRKVNAAKYNGIAMVRKRELQRIGVKISFDYLLFLSTEFERVLKNG